MKTTESLPDDILKQIANSKQNMDNQPMKKWGTIAAVVVIGIIGFRMYRSHAAALAAKGKKKAAAVPVGTVAARSGDIPVYLDGLGSVNAYYTVTVHSRVDGQLMNVHFREGQYVKEGDLIAEIDPRPYQAQLDQAEGQLAKDQALLADANLDLDRYKDLLAQQAIPKQQLDTQVATVGQYEGLVKNDKAVVDAAKLNLIYCHITSPINGRVGLRQVDPGNIVHAADTNGLVVITQLQPISVIFTLAEDNLPALMRRLREDSKLIALAYNRDKSQQLASGTLLTVDNQIDPTTGTSKLKAVFSNEDNALFPNQFVNVRLLLETRHNQVLVPSAAIQTGASGTFVYVVKADNTVEARPVTIGIVENGSTSIDKGLAPGETVVVDGAENLQPGSPIASEAPSHDDGSKSGASVSKG